MESPVAAIIRYVEKTTYTAWRAPCGTRSSPPLQSQKDPVIEMRLAGHLEAGFPVEHPKRRRLWPRKPADEQHTHGRERTRQRRRQRSQRLFEDVGDHQVEAGTPTIGRLRHSKSRPARASRSTCARAQANASGSTSVPGHNPRLHRELGRCGRAPPCPCRHPGQPAADVLRQSTSSAPAHKRVVGWEPSPNTDPSSACRGIWASASTPDAAHGRRRTEPDGSRCGRRERG